MSKRAEERGLEALPPRWRKTKDGKGKVDSALPVRKFYIRAYEQAEKDLGWHSVDESLPPVDEEVIVLRDELDNYLLPDASFVGVGHIVNPDLTVDIDGKPYKVVSHNGWNVPGVVWWMPMPKIPNKDE